SLAALEELIAHGEVGPRGTRSSRCTLTTPILLRKYITIGSSNILPSEISSPRERAKRCRRSHREEELLSDRKKIGSLKSTSLEEISSPRERAKRCGRGHREEELFFQTGKRSVP